ncbi:MAG: hypothetical protein HPY66_3052 [Firmicutes bacterium]|nr:hypothetical protein [Bacillota bacterium]MDI6707442.1 hypothetical protein [Bacillota bacterium]
MNYGQLNEHGAPGDAVDITYTPHNKELQVVRQGQTVYRRSIEDIAIKIHEKNKGKNSLNQAEMTFSEENESVRVLYIFKHISGSEGKAAGEINIDQPELYLFVKLIK